MRKEIFFAYESGHRENIDAIKKAVDEFNQHQKTYTARTWQELGVTGKIINKTIFDAIDRCEVFACDMTYINHNVLFELGYAIGKKKKLLILLNKTVNGSVGNYSNFKILKNVGYESFTNYKQVVGVLQKSEKSKTILLEQLINITDINNNTHDILYIASKIENQASLELTDMLKNSDFKIIYDNMSEVEYQTLIWYIKSLLQAKFIIIHLLGVEKSGNFYSNAEASLYAGLGCGLGKKVLLIAPSPFRAPIDYSDILIEYGFAEECVIKTEDWIKKNIAEMVVEEEGTLIEKASYVEKKKFNLLKLGVGCEIAEEEKDRLLNYFIKIDAYEKAFSREQSIFVGRKGTGKSAIFIKLANDLEMDERNYNVILKPEAEELLENIEMSKLYNSEHSKRTFFYNVWGYVLYSKLFLALHKRIIQKNIVYRDDNSIENRILEFYKKFGEWIDLNFFGIIKKINEKVEGKSLIDNPQILADLNKLILQPLKSMVKEHFRDKKYFCVNVLADNLDKTWQAKHKLDLQSEMILSLLEFTKKLTKDVTSEKDSEAKINTILFLRTDIFDYILRVAREPDKLVVRSYDIEWDKHPNLLRKLVEKRFEYILNLTSSQQIAAVWRDYFDINGRKHPFEVIRRIIVIRPRDIIYFMSKLFESAVDNDHMKIDKQDLSYAIEVYTKFLHNNLIAEMNAEFPNIEEIFVKLQENYGQTIQYKNFVSLVSSFKYDSKNIDNLLNSLFKKRYLLAINTKGNENIRDLQTLKKKLNEKFLFFKKNRIVLVPHPDEYRVRTKWGHL